MEGKYKFDIRDELLEVILDLIWLGSDCIFVFIRCFYNMCEFVGVFIVCDYKIFMNKDELLFGKFGS